MDIEFNKNDDANRQLVYTLKTKFKKVALGGGEKKIEKQPIKC